MRRWKPWVWTTLLVFSVTLAWSAPVSADTSTGLPTLSISNAQGISKNGNVELEFTITNVGDGAAIFPAFSAIYDIRENNQVVTTSPISSYGDLYKIGESRQQKVIIYNRAPGKYTFVMTVDPSNKVKEKDETRHQATITVDVPGWDLTIISARVTTENPSTTANIEVQVMMRNLGPGRWLIFEGRPLLTYGVQGFNNTKQFLAPRTWDVEPTGTFWANLTIEPFTTQMGTYNIVVTIQQPGDPNPANNTVTVPVNVKMPVPKDVKLAPDNSHPQLPDRKPPVRANPEIPKDAPGPGPSGPGR